MNYRKPARLRLEKLMSKGQIGPEDSWRDSIKNLKCQNFYTRQTHRLTTCRRLARSIKQEWLALGQSRWIAVVFIAILLLLMPLTMPAAQDAEMKGYATLHLRILSTAGLVVRPVVVVLQNQDAGLRIELSQSEDSAREGLGAGKTLEPFEEVILSSVPYGKYKVSVRSPLMRQVESNLEIHVEAPVFSRSIFMAEDRPLRQWDSGSGPPPMLKVESRSVPEAFA